MVPNIILEEEKEVFCQWADQYDQWEKISYTPMEEDETGGSHSFNDDNRVFNITKLNKMGNRSEQLSVKCLNRVTSRIFISANVNHKYMTYKANY